MKRTVILYTPEEYSAMENYKYLAMFAEWGDGCDELCELFLFQGTDCSVDQWNQFLLFQLLVREARKDEL